MRATYEDLLRVARRAGAAVDHEMLQDPIGLATGWQAVLTATRNHLAWLRGRLDTPDLEIEALADDSSSFYLLAQAIGAGADLLALQNARSSSRLRNVDDFVAARAEVASIALVAASAVWRSLYECDQTAEPARRLRAHLIKVTSELEQLAKADSRRSGLGLLGGLAAGGPRMAAHGPELMARNAVRWQRAHDVTAPMTLLTRDLRSTTAQLRTAGGYAWYLADHLLSATRRLELGWFAGHQLKSLLGSLEGFESSSARVARSWQQRLSDVSGQSAAPGEAAFLDLSATFNHLARRGDRLLRSLELVPDERSAVRVAATLDELVHCASRVAWYQEHSVVELIHAGRLFVPLAVLVRKEPMRWPTRVGSRYRPQQWTVTTRLDCFSELTELVGEGMDHLLDASISARRLAGTANHLRPDREYQSALPWSAIEEAPSP